jgi:type I restriction-modification system DNA methylase subunit
MSPQPPSFSASFGTYLNAISYKSFDFAVVNPPFSTRVWSNGLDPANDLYGRFADGVRPAQNGDCAFLLHVVLRSLKSTGKRALLLPHSVLFRGNVDGDIRRNIIRIQISSFPRIGNLGFAIKVDISLAFQSGHFTC